MDQFARYGIVCVVALMAVLITTANLAEASDSDEREIVRTAMEEPTPQQKYEEAILDAGSAYGEALQSCADQADAASRSCLREARDAYERDIAVARLILKSR